MDALRGSLILGVGITTFLVVAAVVTGILAATIEFSVFLGIPAGVIGGAIATLIADRVLRTAPSAGTVALSAAIAADGYTVLAGFALRYTISATRATLTPAVIGGSSLVIAVVVGLVVYVRRSRSP
ncbi:MAG: hypothetical protein ABEH64_01435 [Salinirussus sp.]